MTSKRASVANLRRQVRLESGLTRGEDLKTATMYRLERRFGQSIYELLAPTAGLGAVLAKRYGVTESVISKWRKKLGIKVTNSGQYTPVII